MGATPEFSGTNYFFTANPINLIVDGTAASDTLVFFSSADLGGLNSVFSSLPDLAGFQLYSGSESDPTLLTGVFKLWDLDGTGWYTLTASAVGVPAPEPSTVLMLVSGLFAVGLGFKRRLTNQTEVN
jgi:PEP-CTERM motif